MAELEDDVATGIVLSDETVVIAVFHAPAPTGDVTVFKALEGTAGVGEVATGIAKQITAAEHLTSIGVDLKGEQTRAMGRVTVAVVEESEHAVVVEPRIVLAVEALGLIETIAVDAPEDLTRAVLNLQDGVEHSE